MIQRYFEPELETASRETMTRLQTERLREQVQHAYRGSPFYRKKLDEAGVRPDHIRTLDNVPRLPSTTKEELKKSQTDHPLWGNFLAVPFEDCLRVHMTSATTGRALAFLDTKED